MHERFRAGLVVGKFCPLHRGHQRLIDHAVACCDRVYVVSYTRPEFDRCEPIRRDHWLESLYPTLRYMVIDDRRLASLCQVMDVPVRTLPDNDDAAEVHRAFVGWLCTHILRWTFDAVFTSEAYGDGFAQALQRHFRETGEPTARVTHVCVDPSREQVPISGTQLRADPHTHSDYLSPVVYADFVERIALLGGESSGKSTLAQALAARLGVCWAPEYGRERWEQRDGNLILDDMTHIASTQIARENTLAQQTHRWLVCDTTPLTTLLYSRDMFGEVEPALESMAERHYDHVFLCAPDFDFVQDGTRRDDAFRLHQHAWYLRELRAREIPFVLLSGSVENRIESILKYLDD